MSDLIDRQAAIDYFVTNVGFHDEDGYPIEDECELREIWTGYFDGILSAQPKKGKWIYRIDDLFPAESTMECNQCHAEQPLTCDDEFCPHCGARMGVEE